MNLNAGKLESSQDFDSPWGGVGNPRVWDDYRVVWIVGKSIQVHKTSVPISRMRQVNITMTLVTPHEGCMAECHSELSQFWGLGYPVI